MKNLNLLLLLFGLLLQIQLKAENAPKWIIVGQILEQGSDMPLPYVTAALNLKKDSSMIDGTTTDLDGYFRFDKVEKNDYLLKLSFIGFEDKYITSFTFDNNNKEIDLGTVFLRPSNNLLEEVVVEAKMNPLSNSISKQVLNVSQNISAAGGTAIDALKSSPSIQTDADDNIQLRGSSSFIVLVNGKPTALEPTEALRQLPANQIKNIEIITNPSVKYRSEGGAGIINIIMKRGYNSGMNGLTNITLGSNKKYGANANVNWNTEKLSLSGSMNFRDFTNRAFHDYDKTYTPNDTVFYGSMDQNRLFRKKNLDLRLGLNYQVDEKTNIDYAFHGGQNNMSLEVGAKTYGHSIPEYHHSRNFNTYDFSQKPKFLTNSLGLTRTLGGKGSLLDINAYYSFIDYYMITKQIMAKADADFNPIDPTPYMQDVIDDNHSHDLRMDLDYTTPINNQLSLETGGSFHRYLRVLDITYAQFNHEQNTWINNPLYTSVFDFDEDVYGAYANVKGSYQGVQMSIGLRTELTERLLKQRSAEAGFVYEKLNWFPGFSFSKTFNDKHDLGLAMSNRINRPNEHYLNPYPEFEDEYFAAEGNPHLVPELIRNLEFSYKNIREKSVLSANVFYRKTTDKIEQILIEREDGKLQTSFHNDARDRSIGVELMGDFNPYAWWNMNASSSLFYHKIMGNVANENLEKSNATFNVQLVNAFQIKSKTNVQLINFYRSPTQNLQYNVTGFFFTDFSVKHNFLRDKLNVGLTVKDVFDTMNYGLITDAQNTHVNGFFNGESRTILLNMSYQISNYQKKTKDVQTEFDM